MNDADGSVVSRYEPRNGCHARSPSAGSMFSPPFMSLTVPPSATGGPHAAFFKPNFLMRETNVLGLILSNSAAPPGP